MCLLPLTAGFSPAAGNNRLFSRRQSWLTVRKWQALGEGSAKENVAGAVPLEHRTGELSSLLLRGVLQDRLLGRLQHRGGFLGHCRALEEARVLRAPQPHRVGEHEVAEIVV